MVKILKAVRYIDDYGITIDLETDIGLLSLFFRFPRLHKWLNLRSVFQIQILYPYIKSEILGIELNDLHIRNLSRLVYQVIMKADQTMIFDTGTWDIVKKYRKEYGRVED